MIPEAHLLRRIDGAIDFSFIGKLCELLYCLDNGWPAVDPELLFRMIFIGYLYGVKSERRLEEEVNYNLAYMDDAIFQIRFSAWFTASAVNSF